MATPTLNDILNQVNNFVGDASTGGATEQTRKIFCINVAKDYLLSLVGLPASEVTQSISYIDNNNFYPITAGMLEPIAIRYDETQGQSSNNKRENSRRSFLYRRPEELHRLEQRQANDAVIWGTDYANNTNNVVIITNNIIPSLQIDNCDQTTNWTALGDANTLTVDPNVFKEGNGSLSFTITPSSGRATLKRVMDTATDFTKYLYTGVFQLDWFVQTITGLTSINLKITSDTGNSPANYYLLTATLQSNGSAFASGVWNTITFNWANATLVGSPVITSIQSIFIEIDLNTGTMPTLPLWRIDDFELFSPDDILFTYYTGNVIQDANTPTLMKNDFVANGDVASFAAIDPSIIKVVAAYAAMLYRPTSLQMNSDFIKTVAEQGIQDLQYRFPKRVLPYMGTFGVVRR